MNILCCQVLEDFDIHFCAGSLKCTGTVVFAVSSREYRNKYTRFCNFVFAYINVFCMIQLVFCRFFIFFTGNCLEDSFQSSFPCFYCFCLSDHSISVGEFAIPGNFTDQCVSDGKLADFFCRNFHDDVTKSRSKEISRIQIMLDLYTNCVTKCHLGNCCCNTVTIQCIGRNNFAVLDIIMEFFVLIHDSCVIRQIILITRCTQPYQFISCFFEFRCDHILDLSYIYGKRNKCRRYVDLIESTGHTVFAADGRKSKSHLCRICTKQCGEWLTPSLRIFCHTTEVFLECETDFLVITTCCNDSCNRFCHCIGSSVIRAPGGQIRVKTIAHHGNGVCLSVLYRNFGYHALCLGKLILTTIWHKYTACSDRTVEHLNKAFL